MGCFVCAGGDSPCSDGIQVVALMSRPTAQAFRGRPNPPSRITPIGACSGDVAAPGRRCRPSWARPSPPKPAVPGEDAQVSPMLDRSVDVDPPVILVVEDNPTGLKTVRVTLEKAGYTVLEARSGHALIEMMAHRPDLIVQDVILPDIDGFELVRRVRGLPGGKDIPIIAYTGFLTAAEEARSIETGFTDYLFKPVAPRQLLEMVGAYLPDRDLQKPGGRGRRLLVVDDDPTHRRLIAARLERAGFVVVASADAADALARAREVPPDLILSDVLMPDIDGFQFCLQVREDPRLARIPVLLVSSFYSEEIDQRLARNAGANDLVDKSPGFESIVAAVVANLDTPPPSRAVVPGPALGEDYSRRLAQQLDRQVSLNAHIRQRLMRREAELAVLSSLVEALKFDSVDEILEEMLHKVLHALGASRGVIYLSGPNGTLRPRAWSGYPDSTRPQLDDFFGHIRVLREALTRKIPQLIPSFTFPPGAVFGSERVEQSALISPLLQRGECVGVLVATSGQRVLTEEMRPFARAVGNQIGQALGLVQVLGAAQQGERRFRDTFDHLPIGLARTTPNGEIIDANPAFVSMVGYPDAEALRNVNVADLYIDSAPRPQPDVSVVAEYPPTGGEVWLRRRDGSTQCVWRVSRAIRDPHEGVVYYEEAIVGTAKPNKPEKRLRVPSSSRRKNHGRGTRRS
jgi:PAS domain S-box-containing protein